MKDMTTLLLAAALLVVVGCTKDAREPPVKAGSGDRATPGGVTPTNGHGLSAGALDAADQLRRFIGDKLVQSKDEAAHDVHVVEARRQLSDLRTKNKTDSDRKVTLLLALLMAKDNERKRLVFLTRKGLDYAAVQEDIKSLYEARERCDAELSGWLDKRTADRTALEGGPCLAEALQAAAIVGQ